MYQPVSPWNFDYRRAVLDEVALEGLDGIGIPGLWTRLKHRMSIEISEKLKEQIWTVLVKSQGSITFYQLPEPPPEVKIIDRFTFTDDNGFLLEPPDHVDGPYVYNPIPSEYGSCQFHSERKEIQHRDLASMSYREALVKYDGKVVVVASKEERWHAIAPNMPFCDSLKITQHCLLEVIAKSRSNGLMTTGLTNLNKIVKDPKILHYLKKELQDLKLVTAKVFLHTVAPNKTANGTLLRLARFNVPTILNLPRNGKLYGLIARLQSMPDKTDSIANAKKYLNMDHKTVRKLLGRSDASQFFKMKCSEPVLTKNKKGIMNKKPKATQLVQLDIQSEESAASEGEERDEEGPNEYRVGVGIMRQAYQRILDSGTAGLTLVDLARTLNINFYGSRQILKTLCTSNTVKHILEDKGRQRIKRYISVASLPESNSKFAREKEILLQYLRDAPKVQENITEVDTEFDNSGWNFTNAITEVRQLSDIPPQIPYSKILDTKGKQPSLRQIISTNAIIKLIHEKLVIPGTQDLNNMVHKVTGQELMDAKTLKRILQKLINDNLMRFYKVKWPGKTNQFTFFLCAPSITPRHPIIKTNYGDICLRSYRSMHALKKEKVNPVPSEALDKDYYYPKYMRARKIHEFLFEFVYGEKAVNYNCGFPVGCFNLTNIIPEMTVEMALGHIHAKSAALMHLANNSSVSMIKIKDAPDDVCRTLLGTTAMILTLKKNLFTLSAFGLIQFCDETCLQIDGATNTNKCIYYLNRNAKLVNTSGNWPDPSRECEVLRYHFKSSSDVTDFWSTLYSVSTHTVLTTPKSDGRVVLPAVELCLPEEALGRDNGDLAAGDGRGAAGFDGCYHPEFPRLWSSHYVKYASTTTGVKRKHLDLKNFPPRPRIPRKKPKLARNEAPKPVPKKKLQKPNRGVAVKPLPNKPVKDHRQLKRKRIMTLLKWSTLQDKIIIWTRVAKTLMSPTTVPGALQVANFVARDIISRISDARSCSTCHQRALALRRDLSVVKTEAKLVSELRRRPALMNKYGGLCKKLRMKNLGQFTKYIQEAQLRMTELVWTISNLSNLKNYDHSVPCIATSLQDLMDRFNLNFLNHAYENKQYNTLDEIHFGTLKEGVIQTMTSLIDTTPTMEQSLKIYKLFKDHPEERLRLVIEELRKLGVVSQQDKTLASNFKKLTSKEAVSYSSTFKLSAVYLRRWHNLYSSEFPDKIASTLQIMIPSEDVESSSHITCILLESNVAGNIQLFLTKKPTVQTLDGHAEPDMALVDVDERVSFKMQRGRVGWKLKNKSIERIRDLYDDIALTNDIACVCSKSLVSTPAKCDVTDLEQNILTCLSEKLEIGATFNELCESCGMSADILQDHLRKLESKRLIRKLGFSDNRIVLWNYLQPWTLPVEGDLVVPAPWVTIEKTLNTKSFVGWCAAVMQKVIDFPGGSVSRISELCDGYLSPRHVEDVCRFLAALDCVQLKRIVHEEAGLFADDDAAIQLDDLCEYVEPAHILVFPVSDMFIRYALVKRKLSEYAG